MTPKDGIAERMLTRIRGMVIGATLLYDSNVNIHRIIRVLIVFECSKYIYNSIPLVVDHAVPMNSNQYQEVARIHGEIYHLQLCKLIRS